MICKIIKFEEPKQKNKWALYRVWYEGIDTIAYMTKDSFIVAKVVDKLLRKGYKKKDLEEFYEVVYDYGYSSGIESCIED